MGEFRDNIKVIVSNVEKVIIAKTAVIRVALSAMLAGGHVLLEDDLSTLKDAQNYIHQ